MTDKLKPCPFCGRAGDAMECQEQRSDGPLFWIRCAVLSCGGRTAKWDTLEQAIAAWNRRTPDARLEAERAVIEAAVKAKDSYFYKHDGNLMTLMKILSDALAALARTEKKP